LDEVKVKVISGLMTIKLCYLLVFGGACLNFVRSELPNLHRHQQKQERNPPDAQNMHMHQNKGKHEL